MVQRMRAMYQHSFRFPVILSLALLSFLGRIDTAKAQQGQDSLLISGSSVCSNNVCNFSSPVGGGLQSTTITVTSSAAALNFSVSQSSQTWLAAYTSSSTTPGTVTINVNPSFPTALGIGTYTGTVTLTPSGASTTPVLITVNLVVAATSSISLSPSSLTFTSTTGSTAATAPQALAVSSATTGIAFSETIGYNQANVPQWLAVTPTSGTTNASLSVTANPTGLAAGTYTATITVTTGQGSSQVANVTFTITGLPTLTPSLSSIPFFYQIGQSQTFDSSTFLTISTGSTSSVPINLTTATSNCPGFLGVSQQGILTTPATIQVYVTGLSAFTQSQTCNGSITVTSSSTTNPSITIPVTLTVSNSPLIVVSPLSAMFTYQMGGTTPANQNLTISSSTAGLPFTASSNQPWLAVTPSGTTSSTSQITLSLVQSQLANLIPNTYTATVSIVAPGASNSPLNLTVTLTVSPNAMLTITPPFANFVYEVGQQLSLNSQQITIGTTGGQIPFTISVPSTTGTQFITVSSLSGTAPTTLTVTANPGSLSPGVYTTSIGVTPTNGGTTQNIAAQLSISGPGQPQLNVSSPTLAFNYAPGQTITPQTESLTSTDPTIPLTISNVTVNSSWLTTSFAPNSNLSTPQNLQVTVNPVFLTPSATPYTANLTINTTTPQGVTATTTIPVTLLYTSGVTLTATPATLSFSQVTNGATPSAQTVSIGGTSNTSGSVSFSTSVSTISGGNWLSVTPTTGTAPGTISISLTSVAASLTAGTYSGSVVVYGAGTANLNGALTIPVTLTVTAAPTLTVSSAGLTFSGTVSGTNPATQTISVTAPSAINSVTFTTAVATTSGGNWLTVSGPGTTPSTLTVGANLTGLAAGTYNGTITLTPSGGAAASVVNVSLTVGAQVVPTLTNVINAASGVNGNVSPGEIVSIFGIGLGPVSPAGLTLNAQGNVTTTLAGVSVSFNGILAPLTYVSSTQINAIVPFEVASLTTAQLQISFNGSVSAGTTVTIQATTPGIFTQNASGTGLGAILKPDYSTVTASNAAPRGSTIIIYATGGGLTTPNSVTGAVAGSTLLKTNANVTVIIGGVAATVTYAGSAPGLVEGVLQINAVVPTGISAGNQPILVTAGNFSSQNGVTVPVQ
jgi:uncharacterized protein (TIGR03437 family)